MVLVSISVRVIIQVRVLICTSELSRERFKVSHVIVECRVINHHTRISAFYHIKVSIYRLFYENLIIIHICKSAVI